MKKKVAKLPVGLPSTKTLVLGLPQLLKKQQSRFSDQGFIQHQKSGAGFTPTTFRVTQHKGGGGK